MSVHIQGEHVWVDHEKARTSADDGVASRPPDRQKAVPTSTPYASLEDLRSQLGGGPQTPTPEYRAKMLHPLPEMPTVDRTAFIVTRCTGKMVLDIGASGALHRQIVEAATYAIGLDREDSFRVLGVDLDDVTVADLPACAGLRSPDLIICGEILEHLSNPGWLLTRLRRDYPGVPLIVTVPNAFSAAGASHLKYGEENVNRDHVAWYSPTTLKTLLERHGYRILDWACYHGTAPTAEGIIAVAV